MADNYVSGDTIVFQMAMTGVAETTLSIKSHSLDISALLHDVSGTRHVGATARIGGKVDVSGTVNAAFDLDVPPYASPPAILPGAAGIATFGLSAGKAVTFGCRVERLHFEAAVDSEVRYSFDVKYDFVTAPLTYDVAI